MENKEIEKLENPELLKEIITEHMEILRGISKCPDCGKFKSRKEFLCPNCQKFDNSNLNRKFFLLILELGKRVYQLILKKAIEEIKND